jgi:hypothetical protein
VPQLGLPEDVLGCSAAGPAAGVGPLGVVVAEIALQIQPQAGLLGDQVAGERRVPALLHDRLLDPLHAAIGLKSAGADEAVAGAEVAIVC